MRVAFRRLSPVRGVPNGCGRKGEKAADVQHFAKGWLAEWGTVTTVADSEPEFHFASQHIFSPEPDCPASGLNEEKELEERTRCFEC